MLYKVEELRLRLFSSSSSLHLFRFWPHSSHLSRIVIENYSIRSQGKPRSNFNTQFEYYSNNAVNWFIGKPKYSADTTILYILIQYLAISALHLVYLRSTYTDLRSLFQLFFTEVLFALVTPLPCSQAHRFVHNYVPGGTDDRNQFSSAVTPLARSASRSTSKSLTSLVSATFWIIPCAFDT